jgi:threonyl-tRNA synthetase
VPKPAITVTLPDGKEMPGVAWQTSPLDIAGALSKGLMQAVCVASVKYSSREHDPRAVIEMATSPDDEEAEAAAAQAKAEWELWDASRPLEGDCELQLIKFDDARGKETFWHSTAHILGAALEGEFSAQLTHGPPTDTGFFYDSWMGGSPFAEALKTQTEKRVMKIAGEKQAFERVVVTKEEALQLFAGNPFKVALISSKLPDGSSTTVYQNGPFVDLCRGPHIANTSRVKAFAITKNSSSLWLGKQGNDNLQRVYGIAFPDKKEMAEWKHFQEEAAKRDHRKIGLEQELFFFDELSPGSCFFLPHGGRLYNKLQGLIREQYWLRNYEEVITPNMYNLKLWQTSGHAAKYKENMVCRMGLTHRTQVRSLPLTFGPLVGTVLLPDRGPGVRSQAYELPGPLPSVQAPQCSTLKPALVTARVMTGCLLGARQPRAFRPLGAGVFTCAGKRSYRELPIRIGDFGVLHRNEVSGALTGLTRVRRFQQDDGHIFCTVAQIKQEVP